MDRQTRAAPLVYIVVLNWNNAPDTLACLESVQKLHYPCYSVLTVDNGSKDDSVAQIRHQFIGMEVLETGVNLGYAEGNNMGIRHALNQGAKYICVVNNDVRVAPDTLDHLVRVAEQLPGAAFLGPKIYHLDRPELIQSAGGKLDYLWRSRQRGLDAQDAGQFNTLEDVEYLIGAAILIRADLLKQIGLLDSSFFLYREDVDWCLRARRLGYRILYVPEAKVWHRSHHVRENELPRITYYMTRNSLMLVTKHRGGVLRFTLVTLRLLLTAVSWTVKPKWRHKRVERDALIKGLTDFFRGRTGRGYE